MDKMRSCNLMESVLMYQTWKRPVALSQEESVSLIAPSGHTATYMSANRWEGSKSSALSICQDVVHAGVKKLLTEHTLTFVSSQNQLQKMFRDGSVMMKPLLCTFRAALCTLTSPTCAEKKRPLPKTLNHGSARKP